MRNFKREFKFRAWDIESPAMLTWEEIQEDWETEGYSDNILRGDHYIPMQYTGIHDAYGKEIYEDDIIYIESEEANFIVLWDDLVGAYTLCGIGVGYATNFDYCYEDDIQIVGNKHENPELLGDEDL